MKKIAIGMALVSGILTVIGSLTGWFGLNPWMLLDAGIILGLCFGIYKNSVYCSLFLAIYQTGNFFRCTRYASDAWMGVVLMVFYWLCFFEMMKDKKSSKEAIDK